MGELNESMEREVALSHNPEELLIGAELENYLEDIINSLPSQCQLVFRMSREERLRHAEIAEKLLISPNTVKNHLVHAIKVIKDDLQNHFDSTPIYKLISALAVLFMISWMI